MQIKTLAKLLAIAFFAIAIAMAQNSQNFSSIPVPANTSVMGLGLDGYLYVGSVQALTKIDLKTKQAVWTVPIGQSQAKNPVGICFHPELGTVLQISTDVGGSISDYMRWATVSGDGAVVYHDLTIQPQGIFGGGDCAVDNMGAIYMTSTVTDGFPGILPNDREKIGVITPPNLKAISPVRSLRDAVPYISTVDGSTFVAVSNDYPPQNYAKTGHVAIVENLAVTWMAPIPIASKKPVFSPDGRFAYAWGNNCSSKCPDNTVTGIVAVDIQNKTASFLPMTQPMDFTFMGTDGSFAYVLQNSAIVVYSGFPTKSLVGEVINNPDGSRDNKQLLVVPGDGFNTFVIRQTDRIIMWDQPVDLFTRMFVDGADFRNIASSQVAPGMWVTYLGSFPGVQPTVLPDLPTSVGGLKVVCQDDKGKQTALPMNYVSSKQVNFQFLYEVLPGTKYSCWIDLNGKKTTTIARPVTIANPSLFKFNGIPIFQDPWSGAVSPSLKPGNFYTLYGNGFGQTIPNQVTGKPAGVYPLPLLQFWPKISIGGRPATIAYAGAAPGYVGLTQINIFVPSDTPTGNQDLSIECAGATNSYKVKVEQGGTD